MDKKKKDHTSYHCRFTKKKIKDKDCYECWFHKDKNKSDPKADGWISCKKYNHIDQLYIATLQEKFKKDNKLFSLVHHFNQLIISKDITIENMELALLLIRLEYQK